MKSINDFRFGFFYAFEGLRFLIKHGSLIKLALIPWLINLILFIAMVTGLYHYVGAIMSLVATKPDVWYWLILYYCFAVVILVVIFIIATFFLCLIGNLIASPFHERMAEKTKLLIYGQEEKKSFRWAIFWKESKRILTTQLKKLLLLLFLEIAVLLLLLIPIIGAFLSGFLTLLLVGFQFLGLPLEVEKLSISQQIQKFFKFPFAWIGFGAGISVIFMIPIANISALPGGVVGASLLYYKKMSNPAS